MRKYYFYFIAFTLIGMFSQAEAQSVGKKETKKSVGLKYTGSAKVSDPDGSVTYHHRQKRINKPVMKMEGEKQIWGYLLIDDTEDCQMGMGTFTVNNPTEFAVTWPREADVTAGACFHEIMYVQDGSFGSPLSFNSIDLLTGDENKIKEYEYTDPLLRDMTYDYTADIMYGVGSPFNGEVSFFYSVDLETGVITELFPLDCDLMTLAADGEGNLFGISAEGDFYQIFVEDQYTEWIGFTNEFPAYFQSMDFDRGDNTLYWAGFTEEGESFLATIDVQTGEATRLGTLGSNAEIVALYVPSETQSPDSPAAVTGLALKAGEQGALTVELSWKNPSVTVGGEPVGTLAKVEIYRNEGLVYTKETPVAGEMEQWTDNLSESGFVSYKLIVSNESGEGKPVKSEQIFVGKDVPEAVGNLQLTKGEGNYQTQITWKAPTAGMNKGWLDVAGLKYDVMRYPDKVIVAQDLAATVCKDETITVLNAYYYEVIPKTADGEGMPAQTGKLFVGPAMELPYFCDFSTEESRAPWIIEDANHDGCTWEFGHNYRGTKDWFLSYNIYDYEEITTLQADEWFFSAPFRVEKGKKYTLTFAVRLPGTLAQEKFKVVLCSKASSEAQVKVIGDYPDLNNDQIFEQVTVVFEAPETGEFNLGFQCYSDPVQGWYMQITNISLESSFNKDMEAIRLKGMTAPVQNEITAYEVTVKNNGAENVSTYRVEVIDEKQNVIASREVNRELVPQQELTIEMKCRLPQAGEVRLAGRIVFQEDENEGNDVSPELAVEVLPEKDLSWIYIGKKEMNYWPTYPFDMEYRYNYTQTLYLPSELNITSGKIKGLAYYYYLEEENLILNGKTPKDVNVRISLANTETASLKDGYLPAEQFIKVYEGRISIDSLNNVLMIMLDSPFEYTGQNLCILTEKIGEEGEGFKKVYFLYTADKDVLGDGRTKFYSSQDAPFTSDIQGLSRDQYPDVSLLVDGSGNSIKGTQENKLIMVSPNPVQDKFHIQGEYVSAELLSASGNSLKAFCGEEVVDMSGYAKGIYFLKVETENTMEIHKILLK